MPNWGLIIKALRERAGLTQDELSKRAKLNPSWLARVERGHFQSYKQETLVKLASALSMPAEQIARMIFAEQPGSIAEEPAVYDEVAGVPILGAIPAGYPFAEEEQREDFLEVPAELLKGIRPGNAFALRVSGNSLIGDDIASGDFIVCEKTRDILDGKIYAVRLGNEVVARHVYKENDHLKLISSSGEYRDIKANDVEILGRVILSGRWKKH